MTGENAASTLHLFSHAIKLQAKISPYTVGSAYSCSIMYFLTFSLTRLHTHAHTPPAVSARYTFSHAQKWQSVDWALVCQVFEISAETSLKFKTGTSVVRQNTEFFI